MGTPSKDLFHEITSAQSSLNMEPEPIPGVTTGYLSAQDVWAKHALEHLQQAALLLHERNVRKLSKVLQEKFPDLSDATTYALASVSITYILQGE